MIDQIIKWIISHKGIVMILCILSLVGVPFIIHLFFKIQPILPFFEAEWSAGDVLGYYGSVLTFLGTALLSILALYQTDQIRKESNKRENEHKIRELAQNRPSFSVRPTEWSECGSHLVFRLYNSSENTAKDVKLNMAYLTDSDGSIVWTTHINQTFPMIKGGRFVSIELSNPPLSSQHSKLIIKMSYDDKFNNRLKCDILAYYEKDGHFPKMKVKKIDSP